MQIHWLWLATRTGLKARDAAYLLAHLETPDACYRAGRDVFAGLEDLRPELLDTLCDKSTRQAYIIYQNCASLGIHILTWGDSAYPSCLRNIADPPLILYYLGQLPRFDEEPVIGIVGTRKPSSYGSEAARKLSREIAACGGIVVSGMAEGIDAMATQGALDAGKCTVGVLGCGVDRIYPRCNWDLFHKVLDNGCLISEYPPGTPPNRWQFPERNRIISGLSCGVLVVEAPAKSGALITATQALEQGRDVFAVPGNINVSTCEGSNALLRSGAIAVGSGWDVLSEYEQRFPDKIRRVSAAVPSPADKKAVDNAPTLPYSDTVPCPDGIDSTGQMLLSALAGGAQTVDTLIAATSLDSAEALAALTMLEIQGYIRILPGGRIVPG